MATRFRFYPAANQGSLVMPVITADWGNVVAAPATSRSNPMKAAARLYAANIGRGTTIVNMAAGVNCLHWQFVSDPMAAITLSGNIKGQCYSQESDALGNCCMQFKAYVVQNDGFTVRGVLIGVDNSALSNELAVGLWTNRKVPRGWTGSGVAVSSVAAEDGDRLVFEVGIRATPADNAGRGIGSTAFGNPVAPAQDLPEDETTVDNTAQAWNSWIEISDDITFLSTAGAGSSADRSAFDVGGQLNGYVLPKDPIGGIPNRGVESSQGGGGLADFIQQRVYDAGAGWCYYAKTFSDPLPAAVETSPNHTNSLVPGSHQLLGIRVTD